MTDNELASFIVTELRELRDDVQELKTEVAILKSTRALAWKWGAGAGAVLATIVSVGHAIWSML